MKLKLIKYLAIFVALAASVTSCIEDEMTPMASGEGQTLVKFLEGPENKLFFSPFSGVRKTDLFSVRRDAHSSGILNSSSSIRLTAAPELLDEYNEENEESYEWLPDSLYILVVNSSIQGSMDEFTFNFGSGDFAKELAIELNGDKWDISRKYAVAYKISDPGGFPVVNGQESILTFISVKNKYDGVYLVSGTMSSPVNGDWSTASNDPAEDGTVIEYTLSTLTPTTCLAVDENNLGIPGTLFWTGTGFSYFGSFGLIIEFDPETDKVVNMINFYGQPAANTRSAALDPTGLNTYDPDTKTIEVKYFMLQPSAVPAPPHIHTMWDEEWKFVRDRE